MYDEGDIIEASRLEISNFLGEGHIQAYNAFRSGKIDHSTYNRIETDWKEHYVRLLVNSNLENFPIYVWDMEDSKNSNYKKLYKEYSAHIQEDVLIALQDNRINISLGRANEKIGILLTIVPIKEGNDGSKKPGDTFKKIFIVNLCTANSEKVFL